MKAQVISFQPTGGVVALNTWAQRIGVQPITTWRWRRNGWLKTINIAGRVYVSEDALAEFTRRAEAGEFAKKHVVPVRPQTGASAPNS